MIVTEQIGNHQTMEVHGSSGDISHQDGSEGDSDTTAFPADQARIRSAEGGTRNALAVANPVDTGELRNLIPRQTTLPDSGRSARSGAGSGDSAPAVPGGVATAPVAVPPAPPGGKVSVPPPGLVPRTDPQQGVREPESDHLPTFVPALGRGTRVASIFFMLCYVGALMLFRRSWFRPAQLGFLGLLSVLGTIGGSLAYIVITSVKLRRVNPALPLGDFRVAFVVTKAPSEPWAVASQTLSGMLGQNFPHHYDVWICDEDPSPECYQWCEARGVGVSTRKGFQEYHRQEWPRRTKCKEGNLAFFYDHWGYKYYDIVVQIDIDHTPGPGYLAEMIRPFSDPSIGYVAAPSVCDTNAADSWAARGRLYREARLHGPVQLGSNGWFAPVCIGSHYAVRTAALRDIGGIGPELAEDFSTTYLLCAAGWDGAFAVDAEAHGEGPPTFAAMLTQEFQWARSLTALSLGVVPRRLRSLPWLLKARFIFAVCYYPALVYIMICLMLFPPVGCWTGLSWEETFGVRPLVLGCLGYLSVLSLNIYLRRRGFLRPANSKLVAWEMVLFVLTRWPTVGFGVVAGIIQKVRSRSVTFKVTVKGDRPIEQFPLKLVAPFIALCVISAIGSIAGALTRHSEGYVLLSLLIGITYLSVLLAVSLLHAWEGSRTTAVPFGVTLRTIRRPLSAFMLLLPLFCVALVVAGNSYL